MAEIDWSKGKITLPEGAPAEPDWNSGTILPPVPQASAVRKLGDLGISALRGAVAVPEAAVGLADIATGGQAGKAAERLGFRPKEAKDFLAGYYSDDLKSKQQQFQEADGVLDKVGVAVTNPSLIANTVAESAAPMLAGGVAARGVRALGAGAVGAGAAGEGLVGAGSAAEAIRQETPDGTLTPAQSALALGSGAATSLIGYGGGKVAQKLGVGDIDTMIAQGGRQVATGTPKGIVRRAAEGAASEGLLEELPQSVSEQVIQNVALDRPLSEGVADQAVMGALAGGVMGGGAAAIARAPTKSEAMGINPADGPLSRSAAMAVDSGLTDQVQAQQAAEQQAEDVEKSGKKPAGQSEPAAAAPIQDAAGAAQPPSISPTDVATATPPLSESPNSAASAAPPVQGQQVQPETAGGADGADAPAPTVPAGPAGQFATEDDARAYISQQRRAGGTRIEALPLPMEDGSFGLATRNSPEYTRAEFHAKQQAQRAAGILDGDVLSKAGEPFNNRLAAGHALRKAGDGFAIAPVKDGFVVRKGAPDVSVPSGTGGVAAGDGGPAVAEQRGGLADAGRAPDSSAGAVAQPAGVAAPAGQPDLAARDAGGSADAVAPSSKSELAQPLRDNGMGGADLGGDLSKGVSALKVQSDGQRQVPVGDAEKPPISGLDAPSLKRLGETSVVDAQLAGDLWAGDTTRGKIFGALDVPSQARVLETVRTVVQDRKVLRSIVEAIPVEMMNDFVASQGPSKGLLGNRAMLVRALTSDADLDVRRRAIDALMSSPAFPVAELGAPGDTAGGLRGDGAAMGAGVGDGHVTSSESSRKESQPPEKPRATETPEAQPRTQGSEEAPRADVPTGEPASAPSVEAATEGGEPAAPVKPGLDKMRKARAVREAKVAGPSLREPSGDDPTDRPAAVVEEPERPYTSPYAQDLFGNKLSAAVGADSPASPRGTGVRGNAQPAGTVPDTPAPDGDFRVRTIVGTSAQRKLGAALIRSPRDLAQATSYLFKSAVERLDGVVTNAAGKPLAVVGGFKGALSQASVYPSTLVAEAVRVPGAAQIWFAHNHPSGNAKISSADMMMMRNLHDVFRGSGIEPRGLIAVTGDSFSYTTGESDDVPIQSYEPATATVAVPVVEREQFVEAERLPTISSPAEARLLAKSYYEAARAPGLILVDAQLRPTAWVPLPQITFGRLRDTGGLRAVYRTVSEANASAAIIVHGGELERIVPGQNVSLSQNIAAALDKVDVRALDAINVVTGDSAAQQGLKVASGPVFSRATARVAVPGTPTTVKALQAAVRQLTGLTGRLPNQLGRVVATSSAEIKATWEPLLGKSVRLGSEERAGEALAFFDPDTNTVFMLADRIRAGDEVAVLAHELMHKHGETVLGKEGWDRLHGVLETWKNAPAESDERNVYNFAAARVAAAGAELSNQELFPYAVEAAIKAGIKPNMMAKDGTVARWLAMVRKALQDVWAKVTGKPETFSAQDLVDLAFGIAQMENPARAAEIQGAVSVAPRAAEASIAYSRDASIANDKPTAARAALEQLHAVVNTPGKLNWWHTTVGTQYNLAQRSPEFKRVFDSVQSFIGDISRFATEAADLAPKLLPKLETWRDIGKSPISAADNKAIAGPIFEGTLAWGRDEAGKPQRMDDLEKQAAALSMEDKAQRLLRDKHITERVLKMWQGLPIEQYEAMVNGKFERDAMRPGVVWTDAELQSMFNLTPEQIGLYREFRATTDKSLGSLAVSDMLRYAGDDAQAVRQMVLDAPDMQSAAVLLRDHLLEIAKEQPDRSDLLTDTANGVMEKADLAQNLMDRGYAPLSRFGQYTLDVVDASGERLYFGMFESRAEAAKMANKMRMNFPGAEVSQGTVSQEEYKLFAGVSPETLELFGSMVGLEDNTMFQQYLKLAKTSRSAMKRLIERKGIAGFSEEAGRVLAGFVYSNARQTASNLHMGEMKDAAAAIPKGKGELKDAAVKLVDYVGNPQEEAQAIRGLLFAQYLGGSVASAMVNLTQTVAMTFPYLSQYGGTVKAAGQMRRALQDALKRSTGDKELDAQLKAAEARGTVAPQEVHQLMAQAQGKGALRSGDGTKAGNAVAAANNAMSRFSLAWGKLFSAAEQFNRRTTFIAAYRTAVEQGIANPAEFADKVIAETQGVYNKGNKPKWARGAVGGTIFTFKQYGISYIELMHRLATRNGPEGKRAAALALAILFLMSGAGGLPFAEDIEDVIDGLMQRLGYSFSTKQAKQQFLIDVLGRPGAEFVERGVSGIAGVPIDVSGRLGLGNLIPGSGLLTKKTDYSRDLLEVVGPAGDFGKRAFQATGKLVDGAPVQAAATIMPTAARNLAKSYDMTTTGMYRDDRGRKVIDTDGYDALAKAIGFQPNDVARVQEATGMQQNLIAQVKQRETEIADAWAIGVFERNPEKVQNAKDMLARWNENNPAAPIRISAAQVFKRVRAMNQDKETRLTKTAPAEIRNNVRRELAESR